ncbi:hypothetical protein PENTCL1PPCAC_7255 [Pristionchus entomophagus]|uniref:PH domain-containing protein n=1 Tax=Pristionchus entomophagus TaxID=358040 RepID=A0AAV5SYA8_9BILA|nr:hypothetical protein PENTCL1PPCAC_7255 [Pristionchus entomophagus]
MHALMVRVLEGRQLNSAGQLFSISDYDVITDLHTTFARLKDIFNAPGFLEREVDKEVVSIVVTRITAAIRTTNSMETYCAEMVDVLVAALRHPMVVLEKGDVVDSPHCKIATELISSLFLHYSKKSVMTLAIPVALQALSTGHADLVRSTTSYISLAAIYNHRALAHYSLQIISLIVAGNYSLCRVLPQIYPENREPVHAHLHQLLRLLDTAEAADRVSLIMLASIVANHKPDLLLPFLHPLIRYLPSSATCTAVLHILNSFVSQGRTKELVDYVHVLCKAIDDPELASNHAQMAKILASIGRRSPSLASLAMDSLVNCTYRICSGHDSTVRMTPGGSTESVTAETLPVLLTQIESVGETYPQSLAPHLGTLRRLARFPGTSRQIERILAQSGIVTDDDVTIISIKSGAFEGANRDASCDSLSLLSKRSLPPPSTTSTINSNYHLPAYLGASARASYGTNGVDASAIELDKNTQNLANLYQNNRSSSSLSKQFSKSYGSMLQSLQQRSGSDALQSGSNSGVAAANATNTGSRESSSTHLPSRGSIAPIHMLYPPSPYAPPPKTQTLPPSFNPPSTSTPLSYQEAYRQIPPAWIAPTSNNNESGTKATFETTFPAGSGGPVTTTKVGGVSSIVEEEEQREETQSTSWQSNQRDDVVKQFVDNRRSKIRRFVMEVKCPIPVQCTVERSKGSKHHLRIHFACQTRSSHCIFHDDFLFAVKTKSPATWLHLMFLQMQSSSLDHSGEVLPQSSAAFTTLSHCWHCLPPSLTKGREFVTLVTAQFPNVKEQERLVKELDESNFFDCFSLDPATNQWSCFSCAHPEKTKSFFEDRTLEGALKEKKGKWKFLRRWHTKKRSNCRYFTLSPGSLTYTTKKNNSEANSMLLPAIDLKKIRSVKSLGRGKKSRKSLRKAFEIFTSDQTSYVLKAPDERKAEEWMQCLQIAVAQAKRES